MTETDLLAQLAFGEDSRRQFKRDATNADALAAELAAFANSGGGTLFIGVNDNGSVAGLDAATLRRLNQLLGNAASQHVRPPVHPLTENIQTENGIVMVISVPDGLSKPYLDAQGRLWQPATLVSGLHDQGSGLSWHGDLGHALSGQRRYQRHAGRAVQGCVRLHQAQPSPHTARAGLQYPG